MTIRETTETLVNLFTSRTFVGLFINQGKHRLVEPGFRLDQPKCLPSLLLSFGPGRNNYLSRHFGCETESESIIQREKNKGVRQRRHPGGPAQPWRKLSHRAASRRPLRRIMHSKKGRDRVTPSGAVCHYCEFHKSTFVLGHLVAQSVITANSTSRPSYWGL